LSLPILIDGASKLLGQLASSIEVVPFVRRLAVLSKGPRRVDGTESAKSAGEDRRRRGRDASPVVGPSLSGIETVLVPPIAQNASPVREPIRRKPVRRLLERQVRGCGKNDESAAAPVPSGRTRAAKRVGRHSARRDDPRIATDCAGQPTERLFCCRLSGHRCRNPDRKPGELP